jgi:hypothetical protein
MMFPKPKTKKRRVKKYPPMFPKGYCLRCDRLYGGHNVKALEQHHIYAGNPDRRHSDRYGLVVDLCHECHVIVTDEKDREFILWLKKEGQRRFEEKYGHDEFIRIFGRNYL